MNRDIIFMGCRGYTKKYGGWETFIQNLIKTGMIMKRDFCS